MKKIILIAIVICFNFQAYNVGAQESILECWVKTDAAIYRLRDDVIVNVYISNKTKKVLRLLEPTLDKNSLTIEVIQPDGHKDELLGVYGLNLKKIKLYPFKRLKFKTDFNTEMLGEYTITAVYRGYNGCVLQAEPVKIFVVRALDVQ
ncbi:MAG: hypothetical protein DRP78_06235 [Candidatus Omnitrophota bacterium]|nr:MAG: hypothetical protein DRP78_06235 [Candidatus Omnitrophota bacterium]